MKTIKLSDGTQIEVIIESPWLTLKEAAAYCKISIPTFNKLNKTLPCPHAGSKTSRRYHVAVLDEWLNSINKESCTTDKHLIVMRETHRK